MKSVKRTLLVLAATVMLLLAFTAVAGAQTYPPTGPDVGAGGAGRGAAAGTQTGARLPFTGSNHDVELALAGLTAVAVGGGLVVMTRRRRTVAQI